MKSLVKSKVPLTLDLGCGTGISTRQLKENGFGVYGADKDLVMLEAAHREDTSISYFHVAADKLPFGSGYFDIVAAFTAFHWFNDEGSLIEIKRVLKQDGIFFAALVKGADWLIESAEKIGLAAGMSPFIVGAVIVGAGTSFPELVSSMVAVFGGVPDVPVANAIGSNIANILLIVGITAIVSRKLFVNKNLIDLDLPLLSICTAIFIGVAWDGKVTLGESIILLISYGVYLLYTVMHKNEAEEEENREWKEILPSRRERRRKNIGTGDASSRPKLLFKDFVFLVVGILALVLGAEYMIESLVHLSVALNVATGVIAASAVAVGTSLPELTVSIKAAMRNKSEVAIGNIFGSNVFNALVVVGLPGLFRTLPIDQRTFAIGIPALAIATLIFVISGISRKIYAWEGALYIVLYVLFIAKLFGWF